MAPASTQEAPSSMVTPPSAKTGINRAAWQALSNPASPAPGTNLTDSADLNVLTNTGAKSATVAPASLAASISRMEWQDTLMTGGSRPAASNRVATSLGVIAPEDGR